jgi:hypothetical protein
MFDRFQWSAVAVAGSLFLSLGSAYAANKTSASLPLKRLRLYDSGVGYFEREGLIGSTKSVSLPVPTSHLDDAFKSLVVLSDSSKVQVKGMSMPSRLSMRAARSLAGFQVADLKGVNYWNLLNSLKGVRVRVSFRKAGKRVRFGRILGAKRDVDRRCQEGAARDHNDKHVCRETTRIRVSLVDDKGAIYRIKLNKIESLQPTDKAAVRRLDAALDTLRLPARSGDHKLRIRTKNGSVLRLGYVAETPVWRSTYRLVLDQAKGRGGLQAWAIVHNDTNEDWQKVRVELVNGRPDSFLHPLVAPLYTRRGMVAPKRALSTLPQLLGRNASDLWSQQAGLGLSGVGEGGGGHGHGYGNGGASFAGIGRGRSSGTRASSRVVVSNLAQIAGASAKASGALFRYELGNLVNLKAQSSAMLPFAQMKLQARRVTLVAGVGAPARSALQLRHKSGQTLPPGPIAIFADGGFVGESMLPRLRSGYEELIEFGADLDVKLRQEQLAYRDTTKVLEWQSNTLVEHFVRRRQHQVSVENRSASSRLVYLGLPYDQKTKIEGAQRVFYSATLKKAVAVFQVPAASKLQRVLIVHKGLVRRHAVSDVSLGLLDRLRHDVSGDEKLRKWIRVVYDGRSSIEEIASSLKRLKASLVDLDKELEGLRKNVAALAGRSSDDTRPLFALLLAAQKRRGVLTKAIARRQRAATYQRKLLRRNLARLPRSNRPFVSAG